MIKDAIGKGKTTEEAMEEAKNLLQAPWDADIKYDVIKTAKKKTLGLFGGNLAEVRAYYEVADPKPETKTETKPKKADKPVEKKPAKKAPTAETAKAVTEDTNAVAQYVSAIIKGMGVDEANVSANEDSECIYVQIECDSDGFIIGRRGETLDAIQYLARLYINGDNENFKRVSINVGNYREKREQTLRELAKKNSARVKKYGKNVYLDPMNPYERRIIHTTVQEIEGVDSHSVGTGSDRKVVITLAEGYKAEKPSYNRPRRDRKPNKSVEPAVAREPRSDSATVGLYGKIETK